MPIRQLQTRYPGSCAVCGAPVPRGAQAWWDSDEKVLTCSDCGPIPAAAGGGPEDPARSQTGPRPGSGPAGGSAQREHDRRKDSRERRIRDAYPRLGGLILAFSDDPQSTKAWARGAEGERRVGERLDALRAEGIVVLHDRQVPGTKANIDHLVVAPSGLWIVDAKRYTGQVEQRDVGRWLHRDERLFVGGRDCTKLVASIRSQGEVVRSALGEHGDVKIHTVLCFVDAERRLFARPFNIGNVVVAWPKAVVEAIRRPGELDLDDIDRVAKALLQALPAP